MAVVEFSLTMYFVIPSRNSQVRNNTSCTCVLTAVDARKCYATGRGIQPKGVRVRDNADFKVHTEGAGVGELKVRNVPAFKRLLRLPSVAAAHKAVQQRFHRKSELT